MIHSLDKRHKWQKVRRYRKSILYHCRKCHRYESLPIFDEILSDTIKKYAPRIVANVFRKNPLFAVLSSLK